MSRYPIVKSSFHPFKYPAIVADAIASKGFLYTKIDLSSVGGKHLHMISLHTQSSYLECNNQLYVDTFVSRYSQIKEVREFISTKVFDDESNCDMQNDLVLCCGDFNVNGMELRKQE